jgi:hypothetical protein
MKRVILAVLAVFVLWSVLDFIIHGIILSADYQATVSLWRPMTEMKMGLMRVVVLLSSMFFVAIYALLITEKGIGTAVKYGLLFGIGTGISMGYGSYSVMPIPYKMAFIWFFGSVVETTSGGLLLGLIIKK